jgi:pimeloyl-ACP methyl ester carboxylesterase
MPPDTRTQSGFAEIGTARLYLEAWGQAGDPVLLCLHGLGGGTHFFGPLGVPLAGQCRTMAIDLPGSGLSPKLDTGSLPAFSFDAVADLLVAVARTEHVRAPAVCLLGHSMGAVLALEMIRRSPDLAGGLIVVGGLPEALPTARKRLSDRIAAIAERGIAAVTSDVVTANFSERSQAERPELTACFAKLFAGQDAGAYSDTARALAAWTARELPPLDRVSCLAVTGEEDRYAPPDAIRAFARTLPASTAVEIMRDCGHLPFLERPAEFAAIVSRFLRDRCPGFG